MIIGNSVYKLDVLLGAVRKYCCYIEYTPIKYKCVFRIWNAGGIKSEKLIKCLEVLQNLKIPKKRFYSSFDYSTAIDIDKLNAYQEELLNN